MLPLRARFQPPDQMIASCTLCILQVKQAAAHLVVHVVLVVADEVLLHQKLNNDSAVHSSHGLSVAIKELLLGLTNSGDLGGCIHTQACIWVRKHQLRLSSHTCAR